MFRHIIVPLDGSPGAERAIPVAASLARKASGVVRLLHVVSPAIIKSTCSESYGLPGHKATLDDWDGETRRRESIEAGITHAASYLATLPTRYASDFAGLIVEMDVAVGTTPPTLPSTLYLEPNDPIVLCLHQDVEDGQWGLENMTKKLLRESPVSLLILHEQEREMPIFDGTHAVRLLVPLDGSAFAEAALAPALALLAQSSGAKQRELVLVQVPGVRMGEPSEQAEAQASQSTQMQALRYLHAVADRLRNAPAFADLSITCQAISGEEGLQALRGFVQAEQLSALCPLLIVQAIHEREGRTDQRMSSLAEWLEHATTVSLLTIGPQRATPGLFSLASSRRGKIC